METELINKSSIENKSISNETLIEDKSELSGKSDTEDNKQKQETEAHKLKSDRVKTLIEKIKNAKTLMIVSIKNLPSKQFQDIKKSLRGKALVKVAKKNIMNRAIKGFGKESILPLEKEIQENSAFVISDIEGFELAGILSKEKTPASAKAGQISPEDIEVKAGPTSLVPGPAISELGALGIQISIEDGKISIKEPRVIIRKDEVINESVASLLQKLDITPFNVGLEPVAIYDIQSEKIFSEINIDSEEAIENLKNAATKALGFAQKIVYYCKDTIGYLLSKANSHEKSLSKNIKVETKITEDKEGEEEVEKEEVEKTQSQTTEDKPLSNETSNDEKNGLSEESQDTDKKLEENTQLNNPEEK
jgi:large subunit ribosomal protein L10